MEKSQLERFGQAPVAQKREIEELEKASREACGTVVLGQSKVGRLSRMDAMQAGQTAKETARRRQLQLQKIENASRRECGTHKPLRHATGRRVPEAEAHNDKTLAPTG